ncbi:MAG: [Fe-Fe] hydrogenase large subunit C-terminal domain-containing protein, partial [Spirochaetota bacterium]
MKTCLPPVIRVDKDKCVNCHSCISFCPVKFCNNASGDSIDINPDLCIGCGSCISHCAHGARSGIDDFEQFITDVKSEKFIAVVAPAAAASFSSIGQFNGFLKSLGVDALFDVSFGAELTVKSYLEYIKECAPKTVISQPCPAIVTFIEIYHPELIPYLAPADSPMLHTIKMIREYYKEYADCKIAVISPCYAKKREFAATDLSGSVYNITIKSILGYLEKNGIDLNKYPSVEFDNPPAERAVVFSTPGGLLETARRDFPGAENSTRKIEGVEHIYPYLNSLKESIDSGDAPLLVDCLNCARGCNGGAGTDNTDVSLDRIESMVASRKEEMKKRYTSKESAASKKVNRIIRRYWRPALYSREYLDLSGNMTIELPERTV